MTLFRSALPALTLALMMIAPTARAQTPAAAPAAPGALPSPPAAAPAAPEALPSPPPAAPAAVQASPAGYAGPPAGYAGPPAGYAGPPAGYAGPPGYSAYGSPARVPLGPATLPYKDGYPIPDGYHPEARMRTGLAIGGGATFGALYLLPAVASAANGDATLLLPIAGPFIALGNLNFSSGREGGQFAGVAAVVLVIDGLGQTAGLAMLLAGLTTKKEVLVRDEIPRATVRVTPLTMGYGGMGIGIVGTM